MQLQSTKQERSETLKAIAESGYAGFICEHTTFAMLDLINMGLIQSVAYEGPLMENQRYDSLSNHDVYELVQAN